MKTLKGKTLMSILYAVMLSIPMISIISRVIYVQSNKNAYQSYYGQTINDKEQINVNAEDLQINTLYTWNKSDYVSETTGQSGLFYLNELYINGELNNNYYYFRLYRANSNLMSLLFYTEGGSSYALEIAGNNSNSVQFSITSVIALNHYTDYQGFSYFEYNNYSYLDNVFDYSVSKLVDENNFGQLNFFQWFSSFLLTDAQNNMLYVRFANWYLNYAMLVSLMQILFLVLMWFVNFSRKLLERGMNFYD